MAKEPHTFMSPHLNPKKKTTQAHIQKETPIAINYTSSSPKLNIIVKRNFV
jgi:hypothetical protein